MKYVRRLLVFLVAALVAVSALGVALPSLAQNAAAGTVGTCKPPPIMFGRNEWCGYFSNTYEDFGPNVRAAGVPASVNTAQAFITMIEGDYKSGNRQRITEGAFVIRIVIGAPLPAPPLSTGAARTVTAAQILDFEGRVKSYANASENGSQSFGQNGHIDWFHSDYMHCGDYNSIYQVNRNDIAPFIISPGNTTGGCGSATARYDHIEFFDKSGNLLWKARRLCLNPMGTIKPLSKPAAVPSYNVTPSITISQNGGPLPNSSYVDAGSSITFGYSVSNSTPSTATGIACNMYANIFPGFHTIPSPADSSGGTPVGPACTGTFSPGTTNLGNETVNNVPANSSVCRSLYVNPSKPSGGPLGYEACVYVTARPYFRVYGGDLSAGNPQPGSCGSAIKAGIVGWNTEAAGGYGGAGVQYAALALDKIYDVATNLGNASSAVSAPSGLAFANTATSAPGSFGGNFGASPVLPCMPDYYGTPSGTGLPASHPLASLNGPYVATGPVTFGNDTLAAGQKTIIYVNGDVVINGNITYLSNWTVNKIPLLEVIAKGNIYIDGGVKQLDGTYIAQGGTIYTCAAGTTPVAPSSSSFFSSCNNRLVVNGAFIAQQVQLLRTNGSLGGSSATEPNTSTNISETFNYGPAFWIPQPTLGPTSTDYDSITSLPPIL